MRKDLQLNTQTGDLVLGDSSSFRTMPFEWLRATDLFIQGQVILPHNYDARLLETDGIRVKIPYTPMFKPLQIRFVRDLGNGEFRAVLNPINNSEWFEIYTKLYGKTKRQLKASQLILAGEDYYLFKQENDEMYLWSGIQTDFPIINANIQNRNLLLQCVPTNSYRYPTTGVGLIRYLHANLSQSDLAYKLQTQFAEDGVQVVNADFDPYTGDLDLDLDFSQVDGDV